MVLGFNSSSSRVSNSSSRSHSWSGSSCNSSDDSIFDQIGISGMVAAVNNVVVAEVLAVVVAVWVVA
jgi:hypothetical protein